MYGCRVNTSAWLMTDDVAATVSLSFDVRYSTTVMVMVSGCGLTVTVKNSGAEATRFLSFATTLNWSVIGAAVPGGSTGTKANGLMLEGTGRITSDPPVCVNEKVNGPPAPPPALAVIETGVPEATVKGAMWLTSGAPAGSTVTVTGALEVPALFVTVTWKVSVVDTATVGAVNLATDVVAFWRTTGGKPPKPVRVNRKASGAVPVLAPAFRLTVVFGPAATV
jgi:hypothetical protein